MIKRKIKNQTLRPKFDADYILERNLSGTSESHLTAWDLND